MRKPTILTLLLTYACNLKCPFCGQNDIRKNHDFRGSMSLSLEQVISILDDAAASGIKNVNIWGGEPLLHPQIFEIIQEVKKRRMRCFLVTNGVLLEKYADELVKSKVDFIQISIDAPGEEHDLVRNHKGLFEKIRKGVKRINDIKRVFPIISASAVILPTNVDRLEEIADSVFSIGIGSMFFQFLMSYSSETVDRYKDILVKEYDVSAEDIRTIDNFIGEEISDEEFMRGVRIAEKMKNKYGKLVTYPNGLSSEGYQYYMQKEGPIPTSMTERCWSIDYKINVQPNGDVVLCPDFPDFVYGNVFQSSIEEIWNCEKRKKVIENFYGGNPFPICYRCCQLWDKEEFGSWKGAK